MPFSIPTRATLQQQILADMNARITGADSSLRNSTIRVLAYVWAGSIWLTYRFIVWLSKQCFISSAEAPYLDVRAAPFGIVREGATFASGGAIFSGTPDYVIPLGTGLATSDNSIQFVTQAAGTIGGGGTVDIAILATVAGSAGNLVAGAPLNLTSAIAGVQPAATVDSYGLSGGTDTESDDALRIRALQRIQQPPQGGAGTDYVAWAKQYAGVTRAWVYPLARGNGTVDVLFTMDLRNNNIPLSGDLTAVAAIISPLRPVTASVEVFAPSTAALAINIHNLAPNTSAMQTAITAQLNALALTVAPGGATIGDGGVSSSSPGGTLELEQIYAAVTAAGPTGFDITAPTADITFASRTIPATPTITWI